MGEEYKITIGLEIHAELKTQSKMFCGCINSDEEKLPNVNTCPVCMGHPGTLPVINKEAVRKVLLVGRALGSRMADFTEFDRKNYFYPDIPKGYQISQYKYPLIEGGSVLGVNVTRVHLEEDTARSTHDTPGVSLVDFNRAGVPLMELVTEPEIYSSEQAVAFGKELQLILQYLGVSAANMEKGEMRVEVNISVSKHSFENNKTDKKDFSLLGTKVEVKNINSFKAVGKAIDFEFKRHKTLLERGEKVVQETRGWDENKEVTFSQRSKENAKDYRYFPDPDLPKLVLSEIQEFSLSNLDSGLVELPQKKRERFALTFGIKALDIETYINNTKACSFFEEVAANLSDKDSVVLASNYITSDIIGFSKAESLDFSLGMISSKNFAELIEMIKRGELSSRGAKDILKIMFDDGGDPKTIALAKGLIQKNDPEEIKKMAEKILEENPEMVSEYKSGKETRLQFFIGQGMKQSGGSVNPELLKAIILDLLN